MYRNDGFRELSRRECARRLSRADVGRVVFTRDALPAALPVNFLLEPVLLRTPASSEMVRAVDGAVAAFEGATSMWRRTRAGASSSPGSPPW